MNPTRFLFLILLIFSGSLSSAEISCSVVSGNKLPTLDHSFDPHPQKVLSDPKRYEREARYFKAGDPAAKKFLSELADGTSIFIIDSEGNMAIAPRTMKPLPGDNPEQNMGNHEGLVQWVFYKTGKVPAVVSSGDYITRAGLDPTVTNQSGTYRGGEASLQNSLLHFIAFGAPAHTRAINVMNTAGQFVGVHTKAANDVNLDIEFKSDPILKWLMMETRKAMAPINRMNENDFTALYRQELMKNLDAAVADAGAFTGWWRNPREGEAWAMNSIIRQNGRTEKDIARYVAMLKALQRMSAAAVAQGVPQ